jgi:serine/threonine-protein kinase
MLVKHLSEQPMPVSMRRAGIPADLAAAVMCCLEKDPANRFPDAPALIAALDGGGSIPVVRASAPRPAPSWSPMPADEPMWPTPEELARWNAPIVDKFRRKLPVFIVVNSVIVFFSLFRVGGLLGVTAIWSVFLAFKYAKLWSEGYDWRDVFKQPRDRLFFDVIAEWIDDVRGLFDREKRAEVRARWKMRRRQPGFMTPPVPAPQVERVLPRGALTSAALSGMDAELSAIGGARADVVRQAAQDREELAQLVRSLKSDDREQLRDINGTAKALFDRVRGLALALSQLDRGTPSNAADVIDREISLLEAQANPLDRNASEARVRRLAQLKRERRGVADGQRRRAELEGKLESCALALQNLRFDVLRLKTGASSTQNVTLVADRAMSLARDVEAMISLNAELARGSRPEPRR